MYVTTWRWPLRRFYETPVSISARVLVVYHCVDFGADDAQGLLVGGMHALEHSDIADTAVGKLRLLL
jgi:hypothetical protein